MTSALVVWSSSTTKNDSHSQLLAPRVGVNQTFESGLLPMALSDVASLLARSVEVRDAAAAQLGMLRIAADVLALVPAAHALVRGRRTSNDPGEVLVPLLRRSSCRRATVSGVHAGR